MTDFEKRTILKILELLYKEVYDLYCELNNCYEFGVSEDLLKIERYLEDLKVYIDKSGNKKAILYFDGASKGNPGPAGIGVVLLVGEKKYTISKNIGEKTNNQAEYTALIEGLKKAKELGIKELVVRGDSQLVIRQMKGVYKVKNENVKPLFEQAKELEKEFEKVAFEWVPREENKEADRLANEYLK